MFHIHQSNSMDVLKDWLMEIIERTEAINPLADEYILVQNPGMAQWLQQQIALSSGIAAAIRFPLPATFIWRLFQRLLTDVPDVSAFGKAVMTWKLMCLLPQRLDESEFLSLRHYLSLDDSEKPVSTNDQTFAMEQVRLFQLAAKIADTFDQYLVYRPDWIKAWEKGDRLSAITREHPWQPILWQALTEYASSKNSSPWHRGNLSEALLNLLKTLPADRKALLPHRLFVFGLTSLPESYLAILQAIGLHVDVHLMVHNPCQMYWGDVTSPHRQPVDSKDMLEFSPEFNTIEGNSLLASMGRVGRDYHAMLSEISAVEDERFEDPLFSQQLTDSVPSLLLHIQSQVLNFTEPEHPVAVACDDESLTINSCHSALRETEVLHDYLLGLFDKDKSLTPRDIIVMAPDVEVYSPVIQAVFSSFSGERFIPFSISDLNARRENPLLEALLAILLCHRERCTVTDILSILEVPAVMRRYEIQPDEIQRIQMWIKSSGIRWGMDAKWKEKQGFPAHYQNTWQFGIDRLLLGYAMEGDEHLFDGKLPAPNVEGLEASLLGRFIDFIETLKRVCDQLDSSRTAIEWSRFIHEVLDTFFQPDSNEEATIQMVRELFSDLCEHTSMVDDGFTISHAVLFEWLTERLEQYRGNQRFLNGRVNVCTLMPMRSIPFKVICLLGMNDGAYPRSIPPGSFDLAARFSRRGDRSRRDDDRYLFLEALLAAKQRLYISYNGRSITDHSLRAPSVLVSELKDYCKRHFTVSNTHSWVKEHPLQPYSPEYLSHDSCFFTYAKEWVRPEIEKASGSNDGVVFSVTPLKEKEFPDSIAYEDLKRFYRHPCEFFFRQRLGVTFELPPETFLEDEPFSLSGLELYHTQTLLVDNELSRQPSSELPAIINASGLLPIGHFGDLTMDDMSGRVQAFAEQIAPWIKKSVRKQEVKIALETGVLTGWINNIHEDSLVRYRPVKRGNKLLVSSLIEHLVWCACNDSAGETRIFHLPETHQRQAAKQIILHPVPVDDSVKIIHQLVSIYTEGLLEPVAFLPDISVPWVMDIHEKGELPASEKKHDTADKKFIRSFEDTIKRDSYLQRAWPLLDDVLCEQFKLKALEILNPLIIYGESVDDT